MWVWSVGVAYIWHLLNDKVSAGVVPMNGEHVFVLPIAEADKIVASGPALALGFFAIDGSVVPVFVINGNFRWLR